MVFLLIKEKTVKAERRAVLKKSLLFFNAVDDIEPSDIRWDRVHYHRNNQSYKMLLNICRFIIDGLLISTETGTVKMANFLDDQRMSHLYEKFILEYFRHHYSELHANPDNMTCRHLEMQISIRFLHMSKIWMSIMMEVLPVG